MPTVLSKRIASQPRKLTAAMQREQKAYVKDVAHKVHAEALRNLPQRTRTTARSVKVSDVKQTAGTMYCEVNSENPVARYLEEGTGLYGPKRRRIYPVRAKALAWSGQARNLYGVTGGRIGPTPLNVGRRLAVRSGAKSSRKLDAYKHFARSIRGMPALHWLERAVKSPAVASYRRQRLAEFKRRVEGK